MSYCGTSFTSKPVRATSTMIAGAMAMCVTFMRRPIFRLKEDGDVISGNAMIVNSPQVVPAGTMYGNTNPPRKPRLSTRKGRFPPIR